MKHAATPRARPRRLARRGARGRLCAPERALRQLFRRTEPREWLGVRLHGARAAFLRRHPAAVYGPGAALLAVLDEAHVLAALHAYCDHPHGLRREAVLLREAGYTRDEVRRLLAARAVWLRALRQEPGRRRGRGRSIAKRRQ